MTTLSSALDGPGGFPRSRHQRSQLGSRLAGVEVCRLQKPARGLGFTPSHDAAGTGDAGVPDDLDELPACRLHFGLASQTAGKSTGPHQVQS